MDINECSPFLRVGLYQPTMYSGENFRRAFDCRLIYITGGSGEIIFEDKSIDICEGTVIFIPVAHPYRFKGKISDFILNFDFTQSFSHIKEGVRPVETAIAESDIFDRTLIDNFELPIVMGKMFSVASIFDKIINEYKAGRKYSSAKCSVWLKEILIEILFSSEKKSKTDIICENTLSYIKVNCNKITSNEEIGKAVGYNSIYLNSILKKKLKKSIHQIISEERIALACRLLLETDMTIENIGYEVGFSSRNYFCTAFKSITKFSPSAYRNKN